MNEYYCKGTGTRTVKPHLVHTAGGAAVKHKEKITSDTTNPWNDIDRACGLQNDVMMLMVPCLAAERQRRRAARVEAEALQQAGLL